MSARRYVGGAVVCLLLSAGLAVATPPAPPPADPIGDVIAQPPPPVDPVATQTPSTAAVLPPEDVPVSAEVLADAGLAPVGPVQEVEQDEGRPLPPLPAALPRVRQQVVIVQALDKVTAETIRFAVPVGQSRRWRGLVFRARACETTAADEPMRDSMGYLEVRSQPRSSDGQGASRQVFQGWMFASSPGLNPLEHSLYDAWVVACQASMPES